MLAVKTLIHKSILFRREVRLMGNRFEISVVGSDLHWADERITDAINEITRVEKLLSAFSDDSALNGINRNAGIKAVKTNPEIFKLIDRSLQLSALTYGTFDITYNAADIDDAGLDEPAEGAVKKTSRKALNYQGVVLDAARQYVFLKHKGMRVGFGASGKGYAADRARYILQMQGVSSGVINAGGDLLTWGAQPDGQHWTVAAADPAQALQPFADIDISNMSVATSVNAEKYTALINKEKLSAIITKKGFPVSEIKSVSIVSTSAELADALTTPVMSMGINSGLYLINQLNQIACVIIDDHDRVYTSKDINIVK